MACECLSHQPTNDHDSYTLNTSQRVHSPLGLRETRKRYWLMDQSASDLGQGILIPVLVLFLGHSCEILWKYFFFLLLTLSRSQRAFVSPFLSRSATLVTPLGLKARSSSKWQKDRLLCLQDAVLLLRWWECCFVFTFSFVCSFSHRDLEDHLHKEWEEAPERGQARTRTLISIVERRRTFHYEGQGAENKITQDYVSPNKDHSTCPCPPPLHHLWKTPFQWSWPLG